MSGEDRESLGAEMVATQLQRWDGTHRIDEAPHRCGCERHDYLTETTELGVAVALPVCGELAAAARAGHTIEFEGLHWDGDSLVETNTRVTATFLTVRWLVSTSPASVEADFAAALNRYRSPSSAGVAVASMRRARHRHRVPIDPAPCTNDRSLWGSNQRLEIGTLPNSLAFNSPHVARAHDGPFVSARQIFLEQCPGAIEFCSVCSRPRGRDHRCRLT